MADTADQLLFSYGTLQHPETQRDVFGRVVDSDVDVLPGFALHYGRPIARLTGSERDRVVGRVLRVTEAELDAADDYEVDLYDGAMRGRIRAVLASGRAAWVYVEN